MNDKFIEDTLNDFFNTGILKCSLYQLYSIYNYVKEKIKVCDIEEDKLRLMSLSKIIFTYLTNTESYITSTNENLKVTVEEYLEKVFNISIGELPPENKGYIYSKYVEFVSKNCCNKCLDMFSPASCSTCKCGDIWEEFTL